MIANLDPNISDSHKIVTLGSKDLIFLLNDHHGLYFYAMWFLNPFLAHKYDQKLVKVKISIFENISFYDP